MNEPTPAGKPRFGAYVTSVTSSDVHTTSVGDYPTLGAAEAAVRKRRRTSDGAAIYELWVTVERDDIGPAEVEREVAILNYVKDEHGDFVLDERVEL